MQNFYLRLTTILLLSLHGNLLGQNNITKPIKPNIVLKGTIENYSNKPWFYYSTGLYKKVDTTKKIAVLKGNNYVFDLSKAVAKSMSADTIYFAWEINKLGHISEDCYAAINMTAIQKHFAQAKPVTITLRNDFNLTANCEASVAEEFSKEENLLGGDYTMIINDTNFNINLSDYALHTIRGNYAPADNNFCNSLWGWWSYRNENKQLTLSVHNFENKEWGIRISAGLRLDFIVSKDDAGKLKFESVNNKAGLKKNR